MRKDAIRILYIDDFTLDQTLVREAITNRLQKVVLIEAASKKDFKRLLAEGGYQLILSDFNIPGFTGLEVLEAVQKVDPNLPVIILTKIGSEKIAAKAIRRGAADYVIKSPQHIQRLPITITQVLENVQLRQLQAQIQQDFRGSEERYSHLMDTIQDGIWEIDQNSRTSYVNPAMANLLGYTSEEMLGKCLFDFMDDQSIKIAEKDVERRKEGIAEEHEFEFIRKDGSRILTSLNASPLNNEEGEYLGAVASVRDITEQRLINEEIRNVRDFYSLILNQVQDGIWVTNKNDRLVYLNPAMEKIAGVDAQAMLGRHVLDDFPPETILEFREHFLAAKKSRAPWPYEAQFVTPVGRHSFQTGWLISRYDGETYQGMICTIQDITEQKEAEVSLLDSKEKYKALYENAPLAYQSLNKDGTIRDVNPAWLKILGYEREEVLGKYFGSFLSSEQEISFKENFSNLKKQGSVHDVRYKIQHKNGNFLDISFEGCVGYNPDGSFRQTYCVFADITDQVAAENDLLEREQKLKNVLDATPFPVALVNIEGNQIEYWSRSAMDLFGHTAPTAEEWYQLAYPDPAYRKEMLDQWRSGLEKARKSGHFVNTGEYRVTCEDGSVRICELFATFLADRLVVTFNDITNRMEAQKQVLDSEVRYRRLFESAQDAILILNPVSGKIIDANPFVENLLGYSADRLLGKELWEISPLKDIVTNQNKLQELISKEYVRYENLQLQTRSRKSIHVDFISTVYAVDGKKVIQCNIRDISERVKSEKALKDSENKYRSLFENAPEGIITISSNGYILSVNQAFADLTGFQKEDFLDKYILKIPTLVKQERGFYKKAVMEALSGRIRDNTEFRWKHASGEVREGQARISTLRLDGTNTLQVILEDITERKKVLNALAQSEKRYRELFDSLLYPTLVYDRDARIRLLNQKAAANLGHSAEECRGHLLADYLPENHQPTLQRINQVIQTGKELLFEDHHVSPNRESWFSTRMTPIKLPDEDEQMVLVMSEEITERKLTEETLRKSNYIINSASDAVITTDPSGIITLWNQGAEYIYGYTSEEILGQSITKLYQKKDHLFLEKFITELLEGKKIPNQELTLLNKEGQGIEVLLSLGTLQDETGKVTELVGITKDITSLKEIESTLRLNQKRTQQYLDVADIMLLVLDKKQRVQTINPKGCEILGYSEDQIVGENWFNKFLDPINLDEVKDVFNRIISGEEEQSEYYENEIIRADGSRRMIAWHNSVLKNEEEEIEGIFSSGEDITDRKEAENAIRESKEIAERYLNIAAEIIISLDRQGNIVMLNPSGHRLLGYKPGELVGKNWFEVCLPEDTKDVVREFLLTLQDKDESVLIPAVNRVLRKDGSERIIRWHNSILKDSQGLFSGVLSSGEDISEEIQIQEDLEKNQLLLVGLSQAAREVQDILQKEKIYQRIGDEISQLGFNISILMLSEDGSEIEQKYLSYGEGLMNHISKIIGVNPSDYHFKLKPEGYFNKILASKKTILEPINNEMLKEALPRISRGLIIKSKELFDLKYVIAAPLLAKDQPLGMLIVFGSDLREKDVVPIGLFANQASTALKNAQIAETLQNRTVELEILSAQIVETEEKERSRLARELHDQVGQNLALLGFNLNQIKDQYQKKREIDLNQVDKTHNILLEVTGSIRDVMNDLRPSILDDYGLQAALHWSLDKFSDRTGVKTSLSGVKLTPRLERNKELTLFRITQEALTNITQHSGATRVQVSLTSSKNEVVLTIEDNGIGFDSLALRSHEDGRGWGLVNMTERVGLIQGSLEIQSAPRSGTKLIIRVSRE